MYQGPPPPPPPQTYNDFIMQQELHQRLNYGPAGGRSKPLNGSIEEKSFNLDLPFAMHHDMNSGSSATVPDSSGGESEDLQQRFNRTPPPNSQAMTTRASAFTDHSWN